MIPNGWRQGNVADAVAMAARTEAVARDRTYRLLGVRWYGKGCHLHTTVKGSELKTQVLNRIIPGDITYNKMWVTKGAFAVVPPTLDGLMATSEYPLFETRPEAAVPEYVRWALITEAFLQEATDRSRGTTSRKRLNPNDFLRLPLLLPPVSEQRKIAAILSSADDAIDSTQAVIDQLEVVKKAMMAELLTRGLPGRHTRFKQTEIGDVPEGWHITTVGDLGEFTGGNGFRPPDWSSAGLPIIRIQNLNGSTDFNYYAGQPEPGWLVKPGELLFAWAGSRGASFGPCIWPGPLGVLNQHIHHIVPRDHVRKKFLYYVLRLLTEAVEKKAHGFKDTLVHLRKAELTGWIVALPPLGEQDQIVAAVTASEERLLAEESKLTALRGLKSALMSALLTGELRVTPDETAT
jgi:type I restriction enzyme S subunit